MTTVNFQLGGSLNFVVDEPEGHAIMTVTYDQFTITAKGEDMAYKLPNDKYISVAVAYVDAKGNPATVDGACVWDTSDTNIVTVTVNPSDSTRAAVTPTGQVGQAQVSVRADADLGAGVREIITTSDIEVVAGSAVSGTISPVGEPQPIP